MSLALRWLAHNWSCYIVAIGVHIALRMPKIADRSLYWLANIETPIRISKCILQQECTEV